MVVLKCENADYESDVLDVSNRLRTALLQELGMECSIGVSEPSLLTNFKDAYQEACEAIEQRYYLADDTGIAVKKYTETQTLKEAREYVEKNLPEAILSGQVDAVLKQAFASVRAMTADEQDNFMLFVLLLPARTLPGLKAHPTNPYRNQRQLVEHWLNCPSHVEQEQFLRQIIQETAELLCESNEPGTSTIIRQIKAIVDEQYMEQISVASLASQVHRRPPICACCSSRPPEKPSTNISPPSASATPNGCSVTRLCGSMTYATRWATSPPAIFPSCSRS